MKLYLIKFTNLVLQGSISEPSAWAFQKDSELVDLFDYHLHKMKEIGMRDRLWQEVEKKPIMNQDSINGQGHNAIGYENVAFPFIELLIGLFSASMLLVIEAAIFYKKSISGNLRQSNDEDRTSREAHDMVNEIYALLLENHLKPRDIKLLSTIKKLALADTKDVKLK